MRIYDIVLFVVLFQGAFGIMNGVNIFNTVNTGYKVTPDSRIIERANQTINTDFTANPLNIYGEYIWGALQFFATVATATAFPAGVLLQFNFPIEIINIINIGVYFVYFIGFVQWLSNRSTKGFD